MGSGAPSGAFQGIELKFSAPLQDTQAKLCPRPYARPGPYGEQGGAPRALCSSTGPDPPESLPQRSHTLLRLKGLAHLPRGPGAGVAAWAKEPQRSQRVAGGTLLASSPGTRFISTLVVPQKPSLSGVSQAAGHSQLWGPDLQKDARARAPREGRRRPRPVVPGSPETGSPLCGVASGSQRGDPGRGWQSGEGQEVPCPFPIPPGLQNKLLELNSERCR